MGIAIGVGITATTSVFASDAINAIFNKNIKYVVNGETLSASAPALMANNSTYLKVRDVANLLDYKVGWDQKTSTITLDENTKSSTNQTNQVSDNNPTEPKDSDSSKPQSNSGSSNSKTFTTPTTTVITQAGKTVTSTTVPAEDIGHEENAHKEQKKKDLAVNFSKLPITITKGDYTMTLSSLEKDSDGNVILNIDTTNKSGQMTQLINAGNAVMNVSGNTGKVIGLKADLGKEFSESEKTHKINLGKEFASGSDNVRLFLGFKGFTIFSSDANIFIFNIDTKGIL